MRKKKMAAGKRTKTAKRAKRVSQTGSSSASEDMMRQAKKPSMRERRANRTDTGKWL